MRIDGGPRMGGLICVSEGVIKHFSYSRHLTRILTRLSKNREVLATQ